MIIIPKRVNIAGKEYKIKLDKNAGGGCGSTANRVITIGTKYGNFIMDTLMHEILELILVERNARYSLDDDGNEYKFVFDHKEFCSIVGDLIFAIKGIKF